MTGIQNEPNTVETDSSFRIVQSDDTVNGVAHAVQTNIAASEAQRNDVSLDAEEISLCEDESLDNTLGQDVDSLENTADSVENDLLEKDDESIQNQKVVTKPSTDLFNSGDVSNYSYAVILNSKVFSTFSDVMFLRFDVHRTIPIRKTL